MKALTLHEFLNLSSYTKVIIKYKEQQTQGNETISQIVRDREIAYLQVELTEINDETTLLITVKEN